MILNTNSGRDSN